MHIKMGRTAKRTAVIGAVAALGCAAAPAAALAQSIVYVPCNATVLATDISAATSGDTLYLKAGCTYGLTTALPDITTNLTIVGTNGAALDGESAGFSILTVDSGARLTVTNVNFTNGGGSSINYGGAIENEGTVTVHGGTFTNNVSDEYGGAIYNDGTMTVTGARFVGNSSSDEYGGAIYNEDVLKVTDSTFLRNLSYEGGAIYNDDSSFVLTGSTFTGNYAEYGGGLYLDYTGQVSGNTFTGNNAEYYGGAIETEDAVTLSSNTLRQNSAEYGGGLYTDDVSGSVVVTQGKITGNQASDEGGGVYNYDSTLIMTNTPVTGNHATSGRRRHLQRRRHGDAEQFLGHPQHARQLRAHRDDRHLLGLTARQSPPHLRRRDPIARARRREGVARTIKAHKHNRRRRSRFYAGDLIMSWTAQPPEIHSSAWTVC